MIKYVCFDMSDLKYYFMGKEDIEDLHYQMLDSTSEI